MDANLSSRSKMQSNGGGEVVVATRFSQPFLRVCVCGYARCSQPSLVGYTIEAPDLLDE